MSEVIKHNAILWERRGETRSMFLFWCPGCGCGHIYETPRWTFNGNYDAPTFRPSLRMFTPSATTCHLHITDGKLEFCGDCPHEYNGKVVQMLPIPEDYGF